MRKGFTLLELMIVVVVIAILAAIGLPQFFRVAERGRAAEGVNALGALRSAQIRHVAETGSTTDNADDLDVDMAAGDLKYFDTIGLTAGVNTRTTPGAIIASVTRDAGVDNPYAAYTLSITGGGDITCAGDAAGCRAAGY